MKVFTALAFSKLELREDRRSVDVVAVMDEGSASQSLAQREVDSIAQLLGKDFSGASARMQLCPMCCSADMFVRSGAAHATSAAPTPAHARHARPMPTPQDA